MKMINSTFTTGQVETKITLIYICFTSTSTHITVKKQIRKMVDKVHLQ